MNLLSVETLNSLSVQGGVPLVDAVAAMKKNIKGPITGLQVVLENPSQLTPDVFSQILFEALNLRQVPQTSEIGFHPLVLRKKSDPEILREARDRKFAKELGYAIRHIGFATVKSGDLNLVRIDRALINLSNPLARDEGHLNFDTVPWTDKSAQLVRFTLPNIRNSLAALAKEIGDRGISIFACEQPEIAEDDKYGRMAFFLKPCKAEQLHSAISAARKLPGCNVEAIYRVIGYQEP